MNILSNTERKLNSMKNYSAEFQKFSSREIKSDVPITSLGINSALCQDVWYDLDLKFMRYNAYHFSKAFFYDLYNIRSNTDWSRIFVLDGVKHLHKVSGSSLPLVKDRTLHYLLYSPDVSTSNFIEAIKVNPWLNDLAKSSDLLDDKPFAVQRYASGNHYQQLMRDIINEVPKEFTPRGAWGLDFMFLLKANNNPVSSFTIGDGIDVVSLKEYQESFEGGVTVWTY